MPACCPIAAQEFQQIDFAPQNRSGDGEHACEAMAPLGEVTQVTEENVSQQGHPNLPADGVGVVPEEVSDLQGLFDLFEENFNQVNTFKMFNIVHSHPIASLDEGKALGFPREYEG